MFDDEIERVPKNQQDQRIILHRGNKNQGYAEKAGRYGTSVKLQSRDS